MNRNINPCNPEAALIPRKSGSRPSLGWLRFALEELTPFKIEKGELSRAFVNLAKQMTYTETMANNYLRANVRTKVINGNEPETQEAIAVIEKLIR